MNLQAEGASIKFFDQKDRGFWRLVLYMPGALAGSDLLRIAILGIITLILANTLEIWRAFSAQIAEWQTLDPSFVASYLFAAIILVLLSAECAFRRLKFDRDPSPSSILAITIATALMIFFADVLEALGTAIVIAAAALMWTGAFLAKNTIVWSSRTRVLVAGFFVFLGLAFLVFSLPIICKLGVLQFLAYAFPGLAIIAASLISVYTRAAVYPAFVLSVIAAQVILFTKAKGWG